jgi:hypothetical protein
MQINGRERKTNGEESINEWVGGGSDRWQML